MRHGVDASRLMARCSPAGACPVSAVLTSAALIGYGWLRLSSHSTRRAARYALVVNVRVSMAGRERPLIIVASGPCVARARTRGLFVPKPALVTGSKPYMMGEVGRSTLEMR